jgi:hypothetical protein
VGGLGDYMVQYFDSLLLIYRTIERIQGFDGENNDYPETANNG